MDFILAMTSLSKHFMIMGEWMEMASLNRFDGGGFEARWKNSPNLMSVKTSLSSSAHSFSTRPGMLSGPVVWTCSLAVLRPAVSPALKAAFLALNSLWTSAVSHGFWLARVVMVWVVVTCRK